MQLLIENIAICYSGLDPPLN
ncbi:Protein of unknown function [Lactobacillus acidophilus DSM 9126]|nr:Protein of unknown function [Lactobacillus acidophilus DSM 20079 = JCM 1132 = NBRC 13951 = CIP 76.13]CDF69684.1 Protein of unknown function [Lactobacillus acidophilus CIRM-BIA 442]CDF71479.1 Protein of unknown function [Lactobacillus acidophilus CIRM-BIA 445]CDF73308.1 Protein of unknown function [Lactobacillus acidophilus DSM 9126]CDF75300.1 Protein of unknown function [Lactobacillus acidophilus DSM 20242]